VPVIKSKQPACNSTVWISVTARLCLLQSVQAFNEGFINFCSYLRQSIMPFWRTWPILTSNCAGFQRNLQINKVDWKICSLLLQETCLLLFEIQLFQLTVKTRMMTILHSPTLLIRKHHKRHEIQQTTSVTWKCCSFCFCVAGMITRPDRQS